MTGGELRRPPPIAAMASVGARRRPRQLQVVTPEEELENLKNEVGVLRRAVESKSAAVGILRSELQECQRERDKFRTLAEQGSSTALHRPQALTPAKATLSDPGRSAMLSGGNGTSLAQLLCQAKEESRALRQEAAELRCRLHDAQADTKVLREEVQRWRGGGEGRRGSQANTALTQLALQERERFISQMEELSAKCQALEGDVRGLVEEREELVRELDATHHKLHRLNYILNTILSSSSTTATNSTTTTAPTPPRRIIDLDAIITENRYLQQRLKQSEEDIALARSNSSKYKAALERCRTQGSLKLGTSESLIVTPKQVSELLQEYRGEMGGSAENDLRSLCVALVDALGQRSRALRTQRSANRVLVDRVNELERRLVDKSGQGANSDKSGQKGEVATHTDLPLAAQELMEGYTPPAGRGSLAYVKEEDASRDPRLAKFLRPLTVPQPPSHTKEASSGRATEVQLNGEVANGSEINITSKMEKEVENCKNQTHVLSGKSSDETNSSNQVSDEDEVNGSGTEEQIKGKDTQEGDEEEESRPLLPDTHYTQTYADDALEEIVPLDQLDAYIKEVHMNRRHTSQKDKKETKKGKEEEEKKFLREKKGKEKKGIKEKRETETEKETVERGKREVDPKQDADTQKGNKGDRMEISSHRELDENKSEGVKLQEEIAGTKEQMKEKEKTQDSNMLTTENETKMKDSTASLEKVDDNIIGKDDDDEESFDLDLSDYDSDNDNLDLALEAWRNDCGGGKLAGESTSPVKGGKREGFRLWRKEPKESADDVELPSALQALLDKATAAASMDGDSSTNAGWTM